MQQSGKMQCVFLTKGSVKNSVIFPDVYIGKGAVVKNSVIMAGVHIEDNGVIDKAIIGRKAVIKQGATVSAAHELDGQKIVVVAADMVIPPHAAIKTSISCSANEEFCRREEEEL